MLIAASGVDVRELRKQQLKLGLLRASRVLLSCQPHLRQILSGISPVDQGLSEVEAGVEEVSEEDPESESSPANTILQLLMSIATQPSPIKAVFSREELEVRKNGEVNTVCCGFLSIQSIYQISLRFVFELSTKLIFHWSALSRNKLCSEDHCPRIYIPSKLSFSILMPSNRNDTIVYVFKKWKKLRY